MNGPPSNATPESRLNFKYKGERKYVHGTDIYTSIMDSLSGMFDESGPDITDIKLSIRKPSTHHCTMSVRVLDHPDKRPASAAVDFTFQHGCGSFKGWLAETGDSVTSHYAHSEQRYFDMSTVNGSTVSATYHADLSPIEQLVSMTKYLHLHRFKDGSGKWFFNRLHVPAPLLPTQGSQLTVTLKTALGSRLTQSSIGLDGREFGQIFFSPAPH